MDGVIANTHQPISTRFKRKRYRYKSEEVQTWFYILFFSFGNLVLSNLRLAYVLMLRAVSPDLVTFSDFDFRTSIGTFIMFYRIIILQLLSRVLNIWLFGTFIIISFKKIFTYPFHKNYALTANQMIRRMFDISFELGTMSLCHYWRSHSNTYHLKIENIYFEIYRFISCFWGTLKKTLVPVGFVPPPPVLLYLRLPKRVVVAR